MPNQPTEERCWSCGRLKGQTDEAIPAPWQDAWYWSGYWIGFITIALAALPLVLFQEGSELVRKLKGGAA